MMKDEIASETSKSRSQTERKYHARGGEETGARSAAASSVRLAGSGISSTLFSYYTKMPAQAEARSDVYYSLSLRVTMSSHRGLFSLKTAVQLRRGASLVLVILATFVSSTPWARSQQEQAVPAYNAGPPPKGTKLPDILSKDQLWGTNAQFAYQSRAYELAARIPVVLHQQPCYCYCDRIGHNSLHSCFEGTHGAECATCLKELYYSYAEHKKGKTARQIRAGIVRGEWKQIDLRSAAEMN